MALFKLADGKLVFAEHTKYKGKTVDEVARSDPKYVQWARRDGLVGCPTEFFDLLDEAMRRNGVPFTKSGRKKSSPPKKS